MVTISHNRAPMTGGDDDQPSTVDANGQDSTDYPHRSGNQNLSIQIDTGGGPYVDGNINTQGGDFVGGDKRVHNMIAPPPIALPPQPPASPQLFIGRQDELRQLQEWLTAVTPDFLHNEGHPAGKLALIYGPKGVGKSSLIRHWLVELRAGQPPPIIAHLSFERKLLVGKARSVTELSQSRYCLNWEKLGSAPMPSFPAPFPLDCYFWVTLAAQLAIQSPHLQQALDSGEEWTRELQDNTPRPPADALTKLLEFAAREQRPIILACEGLQRCSQAWFDLFKSWDKEIRSKEWPVLLLLEYDYPQPLTAPADVAQSDARLDWLRRHCGTPYFLAEALYLGPLNRYEIEEILLPGSQQYANDLFLMSDGMPDVLRELLDWWCEREIAEETLPGYWTIKRLPTNTYLFTKADLQNTITAVLERSAELVAELGYNLSTADLRNWLNHAVWEGDAFHDQALALAVGWQDDAFDDFIIIVDEALCRSEQHPQGRLEEIDGYIKLPYGDNQTRHLTRYRFVQPLVAVLLRQRQSPQERLHYGQAYAQALEAVYAPHHERILESLATIYQSLGMSQLAAAYWQRWHTLLYLAQEEAALTELFSLVQGEEEQKSFVKRILRFWGDVYRRQHPEQLLAWLQEAQSISFRLRDQRNSAWSLNAIGIIYSELGQKQRALEYYQQALVLHHESGDKNGEAAVLNNIGNRYFELGQKQRALEYYQQALVLYHDGSGDKNGEATVLGNIGNIYSELGQKQKALECHQQALALCRQTVNKEHEADLLNNIGNLYSSLGDQPQALDYCLQALSLHRHIGVKDGEANTLNNIGKVYSALGNQQQALECFLQVLPLYRQLKNRWDECVALWKIAHSYEILGNLVHAEKYIAVAIRVAEAVEHPSLQDMCVGLERIQNKLTGKP